MKTNNYQLNILQRAAESGIIDIDSGKNIKAQTKEELLGKLLPIYFAESYIE